MRTDLKIYNGQTATQPTYYGTAPWNGVDSNVVPLTTTRSYTDVLPSFNFVLDVSDKQIVRVSAARAVSPQVCSRWDWATRSTSPGKRTRG